VRNSEVTETLGKYVVHCPGIGTAQEETRVWVDTLFLEAGVIISHLQSAELLLKRLNVAGLYTKGINLISFSLLAKVLIHSIYIMLSLIVFCCFSFRGKIVGFIFYRNFKNDPGVI
jgi:hypothetical protein